MLFDEWLANRGTLFCALCFRMLNQTLNYLDHFARFTQKENVEAVERLLSAHKNLAKFERAQLGNFCLPSRERNSGEMREREGGIANELCFLHLQDHSAAKTPTKPRR